MTDGPLPVDSVVGCDIHEAYQVDFHAIEDIDWASHLAGDAEAALHAYAGTGDNDVLRLLKWEPRHSFSDQVIFAGLFGDGSVHASIEISRKPQGEVWAVTNAVVCTLEEVPPEEDEEEDEFGYLEDDELFEE